MLHKAWSSIEEVPYCFFGSSIKFPGHTSWKIDEFNPIWVRLLGRSQLSNPSDLPCIAWLYIFSCDQAALWMVQSVCLSVCLSVRLSGTPFWLCSHHHIIMKFSVVITNDKSDVHAKGQGQRSNRGTTLLRFKSADSVNRNRWFRVFRQFSLGNYAFFPIAQLSISQKYVIFHYGHAIKLFDIILFLLLY